MKKSNPNNVNRKNTKRGILICLLLLIMAVCVGVLSIHAYFTDTDSVNNNFTVGENVIEITDDENIVVKNVKTDRAVPCYIRVFVELERPEMTMTATWNTGDSGDWTMRQGDYYYYKHVVAPGDSTKPLLSGVTMSEDAKLIVYAESIQAEAIVSGSEGAFEAFNKPNN
ncbi:MAG: SipW-dependent-type signal peptide-containing protein [Firmicutes bacterium]|nr:SipW-dependent-type signal peptide-containing protein [Bacillota bacterium]